MTKRLLESKSLLIRQIRLSNHLQHYVANNFPLQQIALALVILFFSFLICDLIMAFLFIEK